MNSVCTAFTLQDFRIFTVNSHTVFGNNDKRILVYAKISVLYIQPVVDILEHIKIQLMQLQYTEWIN
jgi:hypothetical protein